MPAENPTAVQRSMTKIADYLQQAVPDMVMSDTQDAYDQIRSDSETVKKNLAMMK